VAGLDEKKSATFYGDEARFVEKEGFGYDFWGRNH